jgi:lipoate-protein ligase A
MPCFAAPAEGELIAQGAKLVGSAQVRENGALLQHGSILIRDDQQLIESLLVKRAPENDTPAAATLSASLGRDPSIEEVAEALFGAVRSLEAPDAVLLDERAIAAAESPYLDRYRNPLWTWRR